MRNSAVPAFVYPPARATFTANPQSSFLRVSSSAGEGVSSTSFWCRRWMEQSRSPRAITFPWASPRSCTSMWRGRSSQRSR